MKLRKSAGVLAAVGLLGLGAFVYTHGQSDDASPHSPQVIRKTFTVERTTQITEAAGTLTLHFSPSLRMVVAASATTDKGYFSLKCVGRSTLHQVPNNSQTESVGCRLIEVHYSDNSVGTGVIILRPLR